MNTATAVEVTLGSKILRIETGLLAQQAAGAVTVRLGDTILFSAVTAADKPREGIDYFPLQVEYREKYYAAGKFPGGFFKREARPSEKEVLTARFTDRPIRPLFQKGFINEVQINNMLLSADGENDADILSIVGASASLTLSELPFHGPIGAVRIGRVDGQWIINPTNEERRRSDLNLIYAGNRDVPVMIEGEAREIKEADLLAAMKVAHEACRKLIDAQLDLRRQLGRPDKKVIDAQPDLTLLQAALDIAEQDLCATLNLPGKHERLTRVKEIRESLKAKLLESHPEMKDEQFRAMFDELEIRLVRQNVLRHQRRIGGRGFDEIRPLAGSVGLMPRVHGSALFSRGETQALGTITLGSQSDSQTLDVITGGPEGKTEKTFMVHYNFPPYSVGEVGRLGSTNRREQGHGALAERSLEQVMPPDYPYTVRMVSDIMGSNGSSSMASVCVGTLALMDAGVPITKPVAGISIGLFTDERQTVLVTDINGEEDHCGDMDFKVAGTRDGITGFQVDLKIHGLPWDLATQAFEQARQARLRILDFMATIIAAPRDHMSPYAPRVTVVKINPEKIGELIGPGGKNIRRITDLTGAQIDIDDDGTVHIFSNDQASMDMAVREVSLITAEAEEGVIYNGTVTGIKEFGAFVEIIPGKDGLVHISELADFRVRSVEDVCKIGDQMWVKCIGIDDRGRVKLSRKAAMQEKGLSDQKE
ncbi:MAG: polyribonucleotide nucleotidyltransferase [Verrucomicrobia bacterium]|nr:polyribonucleotide nucleotidyltransferase [Verrucomicrobiota bacterium]MBU4290668.1 polyribonucleotide nucleotidyltransferase [Verrucomicrobiota bacterium]MBU4430368.1 polyribonucleotide nucleotidyltransferase [Verrucomicrobiota bacterium]MCG2681147.1 polyribonucleotide nucleotidyltransferase [Kiritimatiellia bacterium]